MHPYFCSIGLVYEQANKPASTDIFIFNVRLPVTQTGDRYTQEPGETPKVFTFSRPQQPKETAIIVRKFSLKKMNIHMVSQNKHQKIKNRAKLYRAFFLLETKLT